MKKVLSILMIAVLLASMSLTVLADVVIQDMPKSNHKIKEVVYYDKNPDPNAQGEMANYPAVWMLYDDPDNHNNNEGFVLKEVASQEEAKNPDLGYEGFRINGKWYKVIGLWTVNPDSDIIDKGNGEKAVFLPMYFGSSEKPAPGTTVQVALYDYDANNKAGGISNLVDVVVPEEGKETKVEVKDDDPAQPTQPAPTKIKIKATKTTIYVGATTTLKAVVENKVGTTTFKSSNPKVATVSAAGKVTGKKAGTVTITARNNGKVASVKMKVIKRKNTLTAVGSKNLTAKADKKTVISRAKAFKIKNAKGGLSFKKIKGSKKISVSKTTGKVTVKKGLKSGKTYTVKVKITAAGTNAYGKKSITVILKIKIK